MTEAQGAGTTPPPNRSRGRQLNRAERAGAWVVGILLAGTGGASVFLSDNQAGSTALVLLGALFLLLGIQATPIIRASAGENSVELAETIAEQAKEIARSTDLADAQNFVAGAVATQPELAHDRNIAHIDLALWELACRNSLQSMAIRASRPERVWTYLDYESSSRDGQADARLDVGQRSLEIEFKYHTRGSTFPLFRLRDLLDKRQVGKRYMPLLIVANRPLTRDGEALLAEYPDRAVGFCKWEGPEDDESLRAAIEVLVG